MLRQLLVTIAILSAALMTTNAQANLIGDEVTCSFRLVSIFSLRAPCTTEPTTFVPGPAIVKGEGLSNPEFYIGGEIPIDTPPPFITGASLDVGADFVELAFDPQLVGVPGFLEVWVSSLDWTVPISEVVVFTNFDASQVRVDSTPTAIRLQARTESLLRDARIKVNLVPGPSTLPLAFLGVLLVVGHRKLRRNTE